LNLLSTRDIPLSLVSDNLFIRRYKASDDLELYKAARESVKEVYPFLTWCHPGYALSETRSWLKSIEPEWDRGMSYGFVIRDRDTDEFLGGCGLNRVDENPMMNLGYWIKTSASGRGVATEAASALAEFGFSYLSLIRIEIVMSVRNHASRRVAEKCGGVFEAILKNRLYLHGEAHDARLYAITRPASSATQTC